MSDSGGRQNLGRALVRLEAGGVDSDIANDARNWFGVGGENFLAVITTWLVRRHGFRRQRVLREGKESCVICLYGVVVGFAHCFKSFF